MADARPTAAERADAAERLADAVAEVHTALHRAYEILRERQPKGGGLRNYPLFTRGDAIDQSFDVARDALWAAEKPIAVQGFQERRKAEQEMRHNDGRADG